jgi:hypothetical protein
MDSDAGRGSAAPRHSSPAPMAEQDKTVLSEDPNAGLASPIMDLSAALVIAAIAIWVAVESLRLPLPGGIITAPGLLPFATAGTLLIMAGLLAAAALRRRRTLAPGADRIELPADFWRSMILGAILIAYVAALQFLPIAAAISVGSTRLAVGNFEVATIIVLTAILRVFWRRALWACLAVSAGWVAFLSLVFRLVFALQLP